MKTITVGGIKVSPKWNWSKEYTADCRAHARDMGRSYVGMTRREVAEVIAIKYGRFLAERDGLDLSDCPNADCIWEYVFTDGKPAHFIKAVRFGHDVRVGASWRDDRKVLEARHTVEIPNANPASAQGWHGTTYGEEVDTQHGPGMIAA